MIPVSLVAKISAADAPDPERPGRVPRAQVQQRRCDQRHREGDQQRFVDEVARNVDGARGEGEQEPSDQRGDRAKDRPEAEDGGHRHEAEHDRHEPHRLVRESKQDLRYQREVEQRRAVIVRRVVVPRAASHEHRGEPAVDAFVVVEGVHPELREPDQGGNDKDDKRPDPEPAIRNRIVGRGLRRVDGLGRAGRHGLGRRVGRGRRGFVHGGLLRDRLRRSGAPVSPAPSGLHRACSLPSAR